jgi:hypothetical protein
MDVDLRSPVHPGPRDQVAGRVMHQQRVRRRVQAGPGQNGGDGVEIGFGAALQLALASGHQALNRGTVGGGCRSTLVARRQPWRKITHEQPLSENQ